MEIDYAFLCDYADPGGTKLHALGIGFDTIFVPDLEQLAPPFFFVAQLRLSVAEVSPKHIELRMIDADGQNVIPSLTTTIEPSIQPGATETMARLVIGYQGVKFPHYGLYAIHLLVQGMEMKRLPFRVAPPPTTG